MKNPSAIPGGWCFQFYNDFYPDLDDTAIVLQALLYGGYSSAQRGRADQTRIGLDWVLAMQNTDGGWSAFECGVDKQLVNHIPFNDLSNMLDPSTADVTGHVLEMLGHFGFDQPQAGRARRGVPAQEPGARGQARRGSWWGRWGVNYVYGTWSALAGLAQVGEDMSKPYVRKAVNWLYEVQNKDGGWGEGCEPTSIRNWPEPKPTARQRHRKPHGPLWVYWPPENSKTPASSEASTGS